MGGEISVDSKMGNGSVFKFEIRLKIQPETKREKENVSETTQVEKSVHSPGDFYFATSSVSE